ncbi:MAG TPA: tetratricopeptide repeat protein [Polyangiaceae bacterium]|nr:tetratricopeptide repeat protein [Polyangiaceae bacterium]
MSRLRQAIAAAALASVMAIGLSGCIDKPTEHRVRANAYLRAGEAEKALEEIEAGLKLDAKNAALLIMKGKALFELSRYDESKLAYQAALDSGVEKGSLGEAHLGLAMIAMRKDDYAEARTQFTTLVELNGKDADARINLARVCLQLKDMECAVKHGEEAGHLRGSSEDVLFTLGRIYVTAKKYDEAEKTFQHICEVVPGASSCPYGVALVAAQRGDKDKALAKLEEAISKKLPAPDKLADDPLLAPLKGDEKFEALARKAAGG